MISELGIRLFELGMASVDNPRTLLHPVAFAAPERFPEAARVPPDVFRQAEQVGAPLDLYRDPNNRFLAGDTARQDYRARFEAAEANEVRCPDPAVADQMRQEINGIYLENLRNDDFVGVQTYSRMRFGPEGPLPP